MLRRKDAALQAFKFGRAILGAAHVHIHTPMPVDLPKR